MLAMDDVLDFDKKTIKVSKKMANFLNLIIILNDNCMWCDGGAVVFVGVTFCFFIMPQLYASWLHKVHMAMMAPTHP